MLCGSVRPAHFVLSSSRKYVKPTTKKRHETILTRLVFDAGLRVFCGAYARPSRQARPTERSSTTPLLLWFSRQRNASDIIYHGAKRTCYFLFGLVGWRLAIVRHTVHETTARRGSDTRYRHKSIFGHRGDNAQTPHLPPLPLPPTGGDGVERRPKNFHNCTHIRPLSNVFTVTYRNR